MKRGYLAIISVAFAVSLMAFIYGYLQSQIASNNLATAVSELKNIEFTSAVNSVPNNNVEKSLGQARAELASAASRVSSIKGRIAGISGSTRVFGKQEAIGSIQQARSTLAQVEAESKMMMQANAEFMVALTELQSRYEAKIAALEGNISAIQRNKSSIGLELIVGIMGLITAVSTLLLAWRKDSREAEALRIEIAKFHALSPQEG